MKILFHLTLLHFLCIQAYSQNDTISKWEYSCTVELNDGSNYKDYEIYTVMDTSLAIRERTSDSNSLSIVDNPIINIPVSSIKTIKIKTIKKGPKIPRFIIGGVEGFALAVGVITLNGIREKEEFEIPNSNSILAIGSIGFLMGGLIALSSEKVTMHIDGKEERYLNYRLELSNYSLLSQ